MRRLAIGLLTLAVLAGTALAKDDPVHLAREAELLAREGSVADAARLYAQALRLAEKERDLTAQEQVARSLIDRLPGAVVQASDRVAAEHAVLLVLVSELDPKRNSAFLCAGQAAHALLFQATRSGDRTHIATAAAAAHAYDELKETGAHAAAMATYADGLAHVEAGELGKACPLLAGALDRAVAEGWAMLAVHVATELAAAHVKAGAEAKAAAALLAAGKLFPGEGTPMAAAIWGRLVQNRLKGASKVVMAPFHAARKAYGPGERNSSGAASSGKPPSGGSRDRSKVGAAWKRLSKRKPFVTATRAGTGFALSQSFDKKFAAVHPFERDFTHHTAGGVTLSFWGRGVRLHMIDRTGRETAPRRGSSPRAFTFFHPLARHETWGVNREGVVTIRKKP